MLAEVSSLLSIAMSGANVGLLHGEEGEGQDDAVAIEVRPRARGFGPRHRQGRQNSKLGNQIYLCYIVPYKS